MLPWVTAKYKKCLPSGRKYGHRWLSCFEASITVTCLGVPLKPGLARAHPENRGRKVWFHLYSKTHPYRTLNCKAPLACLLRPTPFSACLPQRTLGNGYQLTRMGRSRLPFISKREGEARSTVLPRARPIPALQPPRTRVFCHLVREPAGRQNLR